VTEQFYDPISDYSSDEATAALQRNNADELSRIVIGLSLHSSELDFVQHFCKGTSKHFNEIVRGNSILAFGHLARRFRQLDEVEVKPIVEAALIDESGYVRGQAHAAADDITHYLGWRLVGFSTS
jgi:hypothetical protein